MDGLLFVTRKSRDWALHNGLNIRGDRIGSCDSSVLLLPEPELAEAHSIFIYIFFFVTEEQVHNFFFFFKG